jgi:hypothetical protein
MCLKLEENGWEEIGYRLGKYVEITGWMAVLVAARDCVIPTGYRTKGSQFAIVM